MVLERYKKIHNYYTPNEITKIQIIYFSEANKKQTSFV